MYEIIRSFIKIAEKNGVKIYTSSPVKKIVTSQKRVTGIELES
ncbi:NAD-binding protein [Patescibacteria group bacterium]|nr:NAD-binding protein [Patescibacteria group bacterium]